MLLVAKIGPRIEENHHMALQESQFWRRASPRSRWPSALRFQMIRLLELLAVVWLASSVLFTWRKEAFAPLFLIRLAHLIFFSLISTRISLLSCAIYLNSSRELLLRIFDFLLFAFMFLVLINVNTNTNSNLLGWIFLIF